jgi:pimeloyl-ACP methyl ester carboxylesterase
MLVVAQNPTAWPGDHTGASSSLAEERSVLVLLQGLNSSSATAESTWSTLRSTVADLYDDIVYFSYSGRPGDYAEEDTYKSIYDSQAVLYSTIDIYLQQYPSSVFDLIGHSLGGVIAWEYAKLYGLNTSHAGHIRYVIPLDSPVNGSYWLYQIHYHYPVPGVIVQGLSTLFGLGLESQAALDLGALYSGRSILVPLNLNMAKSLQRHRQTLLLTLSNQQDQAILPNDAIVEGFGKLYDLGWGTSTLGHGEILTRGDIHQQIREFLLSAPTPEPTPLPPSPPPSTDNAIFVSDITVPDGTVLSPGQSFNKIWRLRNSGTSTWGSGYELVFVGGNQMGAPNSVSLPYSVAPGEEVDISVNMTAPSTGGNYRGDWKMRNAQGVYFGDLVWVKITVPSGPGPEPPPDGGTGDIEIKSVEYPSVVSPGQTFRPRVTVKVNQGQLLESRGDMLRNTDGNLYGAWPHVAVVGTVNAGQTYTFEFYENDPITAPSGEGAYESKWRVWWDGNWAGPEISIHFDVRSGGGTRPDPPTLVSPGNWHVSRDGSTPTLCASAPAGLQYYFDIYESHDNPDSGWISNNCWTPPALGPYGYQWHVKVKDPGAGLESDWSEAWHFNIESREPVIEDVRFDPPSPSATDEVRIYACVRDEVEVYVNTATDGSTNGEWKWAPHPPPVSCDPNNPNHWATWGTLPWEDGLHRIRLIAFKNGQNAVRDDWTYELLHRKPDGTALLGPINDVWLNARMVTFRWGPSVRAQGYRLWVSTTNNRDNPDIFLGTFGENDLSHTMTLAEDYSDVYWWLESFNDVGNNCCSMAHFGIDRVAPSSAVTALPPTTTETKFPVQWGGSDDRSGIRWYDVQYRDGDRGEWTDWQVNVTRIADIFTGQPGHTYCFRARAMDNAGNWELYPGGDGDTCTRVEPGAAPPTSWWDNGYAFKRNLLVLNNDSHSLPAGYPVRLHFDNSTTPTASELYNASQSSTKGGDCRIVYNNQTELPGFLQTFRSDRIDIWFKLQTGIGPNPGSDSGSYQLYYDNPNVSNPPDDPNLVFSPAVDGNTIGLWRFSEGSGTTVADSSGRGHTGSASNMGWTDGKFGWAGVFNGVNSVVNVGSANEFNLNTLTAEAWVYFTEIGGERSFFIKHADDGSLIYDANTDYSEILLRLNGNSCYVRSNRRVEPGRWYHVAWTYDGSTARVYINGELMNSSFCGNPLRTGNSIIWLGGDGKFNNKYVKGYIQLARMSNIARTSFPYGAWGAILQEPDLAAGDAIEQPQPGSSDLAVQSLAAYNVADGTIVQAIVTNQGDGATRNGFWIDLYADHQPTGPGDLTGSIQYWVASPIEAGTTISLTTLVTENTVSGGGLAIQTSGVEETTRTLYTQADSTGVLSEPDKDNNISPGIEVCIASADSYESDNTAATARLVNVGTTEVHNFDAAGDQDWFKFNARAGVDYTIRTGNLDTNADTYLYLYDTDGTTLLAANDDYGGTLDSRITWQAPADGIYYAMVKHWNPNVGGCGTSYDLSVTLLGDFEPNCIVDVVDIMQVASRWHSRVGDTDYDPTYDLDGDGDIDIVDIMLVAANWGATCW